MELAYYIILIIFQALTDSLFFNGMKANSKLIECVVILMFIWAPITFNWLKIRHYNKIQLINYLVALTIVYVFLRVVFFDISFNVFSGLELNHVGTTTYIWDNILARLSNWMFWFYRAFFLLLAYLVWDRKIK